MMFHRLEDRLFSWRIETAFVWTGGALFVASLAYAAFCVGVAWSNTGTLPVSWSAVAMNAAMFAGFAAHHSLFARSAVKAQLARLVPPRLLRSSYVWVASLLLLLLLIAWRPIGGELYRATGWVSWLLRAVQLTGVWFIARSVAAIDALELAGIRQASQATGGGLQFGGPYGVVRHPLYFGWLLIVFGAAHMTGDRLTFAAITTAYLLVAMPWEERTLERTFGADYQRYKQRVRWRIVPYVY